MDCIGKRIDGTVTDAEASVEMVETGSARATFTVTPVLLPIPDTESFQVRIRVEAGSPVIVGELDDQSRSDVASDASLVRERLRRWRVMLDDDQVSYLRQGDSLPLPIATPFAGLKLLQPENEAVVAVYMPSGDILRSIEIFGRVPSSDSDGVPDSGDGFSEIRLSTLDTSTPFRVQLTYDEAPDSAPLSVTLRWQGGGQRVALERTRDDKEFSSTWYVISPESQRDLRSGGRMTGSGEDWAKEAAAKFAGNWNVSHAGGDIGDSTGVAFVSDDGSNVRLFLQSEKEKARYESVEVLATWNDSTNGHTLDVRFQRKGDDEAWGPPLAARAPEGRVIYVTEGATTMTAEARDRREQVAVELPDEPPDRFRASLMNRGDASLRMSGAWNVERGDGSLGSNGMQTWGAAPTIEGIVVLEEQRPPPKKLGNYERFKDDDDPSSAEYIYEAPPNDANRSTDYPFRRDAQNDSTKRTLLVYGYNLPQRGSEALSLDSNDERLRYELLAFPGEGKDELFEKGWRLQGERAAKAAAAAAAAPPSITSVVLRESDDESSAPDPSPVTDPGDKTALLLTAHMTEGVLAGVKGLTVNAAGGAWHLDFADSNVFPQFANRFREDAASGEGEYEPTEAVYLNNEFYITLDEQSPLPYESLELRLMVNGTAVKVVDATRHEVDERCASDSDTSSAVKARLGCQPPYRTQPIKLLRRELAETSQPQTDDELSIRVSPNDRIEAEITNPFLVRSAPSIVAAQVIAEPGDLGATWKDALQRVAVCLNESNVDFDTMTNEESDVYSNFIFTENMGQLLMPQFFGLPESREIQITKGDHAAGILIRDQFLKNLNNAIPELLTILTDEEKMWQFFQTRAASDMPFWDLMTVDTGPDITNLYVEWAKESALEVGDIVTPELLQEWARAGADLVSGDGRATNDGDWVIGDLVEDITSHPEHFSNSNRHSYLFALRMTKQALRLLIDRASFAYARASNAGDCNVEELMLISGQEANGVVAQIVPRLMRRSDDGAGNLWEPDRIAQGYVKSLKVKGASIRALESYGRIDEAYQAMALAAVTAGGAALLTAGGAAVAGSYLMLAADMADVIIYGSESLNQYVESQPLIDYAEGATAGGFSQSFYDEAVAMQAEGWEAAIGLLAPAIGVVTGVGAIGDVAAARRGKQLLDGMDTITKEAIEGMSEADQRALFSYFGDLQNRRPGSTLRDVNNLGQVHSVAEGADYAKFADHFAESGLDVTGSTMRQSFYGASAADEAAAGRSAVDDLFESPVSPSTADPLDNAPPTVRVTDDVDGRTVRAETENPRGLDDLSDESVTTARRGEDPGDDVARTGDDSTARTGENNSDTTDTVRTADNTPVRTGNRSSDTNNNGRSRDNTSTRTAGNDPDATADTVRASDDTLRADADTVRAGDNTTVRPARNDPDATADTVRASDDTLRADADTVRAGDNTTVRPARTDPDATADTVRASDDTLRADADTVRTGDNAAPARTTGDASDPNGPFVGLDERLGPEFRGALDDDAATPARVRGDAADPNGPYVGLDERLGPEFRGALDDDAATPASRSIDAPDRTPVYPEAPPAARVTDWKADLDGAGEVSVVGRDGVQTNINIGELRGKGATAAVYGIGGEEGGDLWRVRDAGSPFNSVNDDVGRVKIKSALDQNPDADFVRLADQKDQIRVVSSSDPNLNGKIIERVEAVDSTADARIAAQGGIPTEGQLVAMDQAKRLLNRNGLVWTDGHYKNFDLVPVQVPGRPDVHQVVIFDTGHVYPVNGGTPFQKWENARGFQREFAAPPEEFVTSLAGETNSVRHANIRRRRIEQIYNDNANLINRSELPPEMQRNFGGAPHTGAERPFYREIASLDADAADQRYFAHTGKRPPPPPARDGSDLAREMPPIRISTAPPADPPATNTPVVRSSGVPDGDETLDVDVAGSNVGRNFDDEGTLDVDDVNASAGRNFDDESTLDVDDVNASAGRNIDDESTLDVDDVNASAGRNFDDESTLDVDDVGASTGRNVDDESTLDVDVADSNVGRTAGDDTTRFDNSDLDALGNDTLRLDDPELPGPWAPVSDDLRNWETPNGVLVTDDAMLGQGNFADVHRLLGPDGAPSGSVRKHFDVNTGTGDSHLLAQQQGRVRASEEGSKHLQRADVLEAELRHVDAQNGTIIQREVNADLPAGVTRETVVEDIVSERGAGPLSDVESDGVARMFRNLNDNDIAMEDPNIGNIFLREIPDTDTPVRAGVLDQDRIIGKDEFGILDHIDTNTPTPTNGIIKKSEADELGLDLDSRLWEETTYMGQPVYESKTNVGDFKKVWEEREFNYFRTLQREGKTTAEIGEISADGLLPTPKAFNYYTMIEKGWLKYEPGVGFSSGTMDIGAAARELPDLPEVLHLTPGAEWDAAIPTSRVDPNENFPAPHEYDYDALPLAA